MKSAYYDRCADAFIAALERRRSRRRPGEPPIVATAIALARWLAIAPAASRETRRRRVRELVDDLRHDGHAIIAREGSDGGYFLPLDAVEIEAYADQLRRNGLAHLVGAGHVQRLPVLADAQGQLALFAAGHRR